MSSFRIREWGEEGWTYITLRGELSEVVTVLIGSALGTSPYHVQIWNGDEEKWEDLE